MRTPSQDRDVDGCRGVVLPDPTTRPDGRRGRRRTVGPGLGNLSHVGRPGWAR